MNNFLDQRKLGMIFGALILIGAGVYFYQQAADKKDQEGKSALYKIEKTYEEESKAIPEADRAAGVAFDVDAKYSKTVAELNGMMSAKTAPARVLFEAGIKLGTLYLDHGQPEKAVATLKQVLNFSGTSFQKASTYFLLGTAEERAKQFSDAMKSFESGINEKVDGLKGELLLGMVRTSLKLNDKEKAKLYLERMNKEVAGSHAAEIADELVKGATT